MLAATPQMLQSLGRVARAPGPRALTAGQFLAIPLSTGNGAASAVKGSAVQLPIVPVVLSTPQRLSQQPQQQTQILVTPKQEPGTQGKNFVTPILDHTGSRKRQDTDHEHGSER